MDAVHEAAEQSSEEMREEIDCTRSDLADKLEALEDRVMGTVQSARDTVATVKRTFDIKHHVEQHPWAMVGGCCLAGLALGALFQGMRRRPRQTLDRLAGAETAFSASPAPHGEKRGNSSFRTAAPLSQYQSLPPSRPGFFDLFHDEIAQVKAMAIGYVMGLARDAIKGAVPQRASQIEGVMNRVTTKLGGEPAQEQSL